MAGTFKKILVCFAAAAAFGLSAAGGVSYYKYSQLPADKQARLQLLMTELQLSKVSFGKRGYFLARVAWNVATDPKTYFSASEPDPTESRPGKSPLDPLVDAALANFPELVDPLTRLSFVNNQVDQIPPELDQLLNTKDIIDKVKFTDARGMRGIFSPEGLVVFENGNESVRIQFASLHFVASLGINKACFVSFPPLKGWLDPRRLIDAERGEGAQVVITHKAEDGVTKSYYGCYAINLATGQKRFSSLRLETPNNLNIPHDALMLAARLAVPRAVNRHLEGRPIETQRQAWALLAKNLPQIVTPPTNIGQPKRHFWNREYWFPKRTTPPPAAKPLLPK